ncbi:MAG: substrate-binding domain-containing protein, partial [Muribaculaceae bacterium]|nr:substrate-binding domain-containing protein [Muribaculaceae bacterium]
MSFLVAGCGSKPIKIGVSQCSDDDWRQKMNDEIRREAMCHDNVVVEIRSADDSNEKQISDIQYFADNGFDIIIAAPNAAKAITPVIDKVYSRGIPVIIFDRSIESNSFTAFQGADNVGLGHAAARYANSVRGSDARVIELCGLEGSTPAIGRNVGFRNYADSTGTVKVLARAFANWNYNDAAIAVDSLLDLYPDANTIYAHNDRMAIAAADVARKKGRDLTVIGIDGAPEIGIKAVIDSVIDATFIYPSEGERLIETALKILNHQPFDTIVRLPLTSAVDLTNADILLAQNNAMQNEFNKIKVLKARVDSYLSVKSTQETLLYAVVVILILLFGFVFLLLRFFWQSKLNRQILIENNRLLEEQRDSLETHNRELNEATQSKLAFFTNVSHDLRTPLTLISEPVQQLAGAENLTPQQSVLM